MNKKNESLISKNQRLFSFLKKVLLGSSDGCSSNSGTVQERNSIVSLTNVVVISKVNRRRRRVSFDPDIEFKNVSDKVI